MVPKTQNIVILACITAAIIALFALDFISIATFTGMSLLLGAAVAHTQTLTLNRNLTGINITDATFQTLVAGAGNGASFTITDADLIILKNDTGGASVFTIVMPTPAAIAAVGGSVTSPTVAIATGKTYIFRLTDILKTTESLVTIECDVAGKLLVIRPG